MNCNKKKYALLWGAALCLGLSACGGPEDDLAGDDWRVSGVVDGSGTITHDGDSVDVLVTISTESAAFYWDDPEQVLYDSVSFPVTITDAEQAFNAISFDDTDGDGESDVLVSFIHEDNSTTELVWIWDAKERYVFRPDLSVTSDGDSSPENAVEDYAGLWEYVEGNLWLRIHEDGTWEFLNGQEDVIESGVLWADKNSVTLHFDGSGDVLQLDCSVSGDLLDSVNGGVLVPVEAIVPQEPYFTRNGLEINAAVDKGTFLLENGICTYSGLGDGYATNDCYWEVIKNSDDTHDGIREIQFDAVCYIPESSIPIYFQEYVTSTNSELYDFYTGMWLTAATTYNANTSRGENHYLHTVSLNGQSYLIEFFYSTDWQYNVGDWAQVLTKSYVVYLPEDYDGLIFAAEAQPDNYRDQAKIMQLDSISPEAGVADIELINPYSSLYFSLCY